MDSTKKPENKTTLKRPPGLPAWLVTAFCITGTVSTLYFAGLIPGRPSPVEASAAAGAAAEPPECIFLAYTVNNLGYTATCG